MINPAAEHDQSNPLPTFQPLMRVQIAHDPPRQVARHLDERMVAAVIIFNFNQISLVVLAGSVVESRTKFTFGMRQGYHVAGN